MADEAVNISIQADIAQLRAELAKMGPAADKEAKKLAAALTRSYKQAEAEAKKAAKNTEKAYEDALGKVGNVGQATASLLGGSFGDASDIIFDVISPLKEVAGSLTGVGAVAAGTAASVAGVVLALGGVATVAVTLAGSASEARDRLEEMKVEVGGEAARDLNAYVAASEDLAQALDEVKVAVGSGVAGELAVLMQLIAGGADDVLSWAGAARDAADTASDWATFGVKPLVEILGGMLYDDLTDSARATSDLAAEMEGLDRATKAAKKALEDLYDEMEPEAQQDEAAGAWANAQAQRALADAEKAVAAAMEESARQRAEVLLWFEQGEERTRAWTKVLDEFRSRQKVAVDKTVDSVGDLDQALTKAHEAAADPALADSLLLLESSVVKMNNSLETYEGSWQQTRDIVNQTGADILVVAEDVAHFTGQIGGVIAGFAELHQMELDALVATEQERIAQAEERISRWHDEQRQHIEDAEEAAKRDDELARDRIEALRLEGRISDQEAGRQLDRLTEEASLRGKNAAQALNDIDTDTQRRKDAAQERGKDEREAAMKAFKTGQTLARTQTVIAAAVSAVSLIPSLSYLAWGAPFAAAGIAGGALTAQLAIINRQQPPEFPMGLSSDHHLVGIQDEEGIASRRAMSDPGFRQELEDANRGISASDSPLEVEVSLRHDRRRGLVLDRRRRADGKRRSRRRS